MADLKDSVASSLQVAKAASEPNDVVRKSEYDTDKAALATKTELTAALAQDHAAVTVQDTNSIDLTVSEQLLSADLKLAPSVEVQAAGGIDTMLFAHPIAAGSVLVLPKQSVVIESIGRYDITDTLVSTSVSADVDYELNAATGRIYIPAGSSLITIDTNYVKVLYSYLSISEDSGLEITADGVQVKFGTSHEKAARGDHSHQNDHKPATGASTLSATVSVSNAQAITCDVNLATGGSLTASPAGLRVLPGVFAPISHTHTAATHDTAGFMSAADKAKLDVLSTTPVSFTDSSSVTFSTANGTTAANVKQGYGLTTDANGAAVDTTVIATKTHTHEIVGSSTSGFMSPDQSARLASVRFPYIGYCDSIVGSSTPTPVGFSTTFDTSKRYAAFLITTTPLAAPVASDFNGLWFGITPWVPT